MNLPPIPRWKIVTGVLAVLALVAATVVVLWWAGTRGLDGRDLVTARLDTLRVGLSIGIGGGGVFALYLAWRRQRSTEADLDNRERALAHQLEVAADTKAHQERVAAATERDAEARRITDLYTKAVEQLGSDKAPVRLGGMYALERLAQDNPGQRQTIVNVWCAYLRMPYTVPGDAPPPDDAGEQVRAAYRELVQEREVRLTAQRLLEIHLRSGDDPDSPLETFWTDVDLDLTGATLIELSLTRCQLRAAAFDRARFVGLTDFRRAHFTENVSFHRATFDANAWFQEVLFGGLASFSMVRFTEHVWFTDSRFSGVTAFTNSEFAAQTWFQHVEFAELTVFDKVRFNGPTNFDHATFTGRAPAEVEPYLAAPDGA